MGNAEIRDEENGEMGLVGHAIRAQLISKELSHLPHATVKEEGIKENFF